MSNNSDTKIIERVCFTGHRNIDSAHAQLIPTLLDQILRTLILNGASDFYAGGARGFDTVSAISILRLKKEFPHIKLNLILPCKEQSQKWNESDRAIYDAILERSDSVEYACSHYTSYCMHERNRRLVDSAQLCVAFCEHSGGGSAYTMGYALKNEKEVINLADFL